MLGRRGLTICFWGKTTNSEVDCPKWINNVETFYPAYWPSFRPLRWFPSGALFSLSNRIELLPTLTEVCSGYHSGPMLSNITSTLCTSVLATVWWNPQPIIQGCFSLLQRIWHHAGHHIFHHSMSLVWTLYFGSSGFSKDPCWHTVWGPRLQGPWEHIVRRITCHQQGPSVYIGSAVVSKSRWVPSVLWNTHCTLDHQLYTLEKITLADLRGRGGSN